MTSPASPAALMRAALVFVICSPAVSAAQSVDVRVSGHVLDPSGAAVAGATVRLTNVATAVKGVAKTDAGGAYRLAPLPPGTYDATAEAAGFATVVRRGDDLHVGSDATLDFTFETVTSAGTVEVASAVPILDTAKSTIAVLVDRRDIDALPLVDRNFNALALLAPGVTPTGIYGGVEISGSRDFQNASLVDGVSAEGLGTGEQRTVYAQDWVQEFQVLTSQFTPEFGGASGGVLNAVTRSGSNRTSGRLYGFFRNEGWDALPAFATMRTPLDTTRLGSTLGGKIVTDRLFYFAGVEWYDSATTRVVNSGFAEYNGNVAATSDQKLAIVKPEWHRGAESVRLRVNHDTRRSTNVGVGGITTEEFGLRTQYAASDAVATWTQVAGGSAFNEVRLAYTRTSSESQCNFAQRNPPGSWFGRVYPNARLGCPNGFGRLDTSELQIVENVSLTRRAHNVKAGVVISRADSSGDYRFLRDGFYQFNANARFDIANPSSYPTVFNLFDGPTTWSYPRWSAGAFFQDAWTMAPSLVVNGGVRYDVDGTYTALNPAIRVDKGLQPIRKDANNLAPRAGVTWTPFHNQGRTAIRGGIGAFYDENHGNVANLMLFNSVLVRRAITINAASPALNPFGDLATARRFLAEALARNTVPAIETTGGTADLDPRLQVPWTLQASLGLTHTSARGLSASVDFVAANGRDQYSIGDVNLDRASALAGKTVRLNPNYTFINRYGNGGTFTYRALQTQVQLARRSARFLKLSYTLARSRSNTRTALDGIGGAGGATNPFDLGEDFGPADNDIRHKFTASGGIEAPFGVELAMLLSARSALPWSVATEQSDADVFLDRPEPRNSRRGDAFFSLDGRVAKSLHFGPRYSVRAFVEAFNLTNTTNYIAYAARLGIEGFGRPTAALEKRRIQLGFRVDF